MILRHICTRWRLRRNRSMLPGAYKWKAEDGFAQQVETESNPRYSLENRWALRDG
jgi:hypothetical protein